MRKLLFALLLAASPLLAADQPAAPPRPVDHKDDVTVRLAEVQVLATDRDGKPVTDLKPAEIEVKEEGGSRKVAYLEPASKLAALTQRVMPGPTPVAVPGEAPESMAPTEPPSVTATGAAPRYVVLLFDAYNSRTMDRRKWVAAARDWSAKQMGPDDRVMVATIGPRGDIKELVAFTSDRNAVQQALREDTVLDNDSYADLATDIGALVDAVRETCVKDYEPRLCSKNAADPFVAEWSSRTDDTLASLTRLSGSLAAIPARKVIVYIGPGFLQNPGQIASNAILSVYGTDSMTYQSAMALYDRDMTPRVLAMLRTATAAKVTFFTLDTRTSAARDSSIDADRPVRSHNSRFMEPYSLAFDETRGVLAAMAVRTGGRNLNGSAIDRNLSAAVRASDGIYTLGFYRDPAAGALPRLKVKVLRKGVEISFPDRYQLDKGQPRTAVMQLAAGKARLSDGGGFIVPILIQLQLSDLEFRSEKTEKVGLASFFAEAIGEGGKRQGMAYEQVEIRFTPTPATPPKFQHSLELDLAPGCYRVRIRMSEADYRHASDQAFDVALGPDGIVRPAEWRVAADGIPRCAATNQ